MLSFFYRHRLMVAAGFALGLFAAAGAIASLGDRTHTRAEVSGNEIMRDLSLTEVQAQARQMEYQTQEFVTETRWRSGDSAGSLMARLGATDPTALQFIRTNPLAAKLLKLRPGADINASVDDDGQLQWLRFPSPESVQTNPQSGVETTSPSLLGEQPASTRQFVLIERVGTEWLATKQSISLDRRVEYRSGKIDTTLFASADQAGVPDEIVRGMAEIFEGNLDFYLNLRKGDAFRVVYETFYTQGRFSHTGRVLAAEIINRNRPFQALWFETTPGQGSYYTFSGRSLKSDFLRAPLAYSRVSSGFTDARFHPIHLRLQAHTGVDYAAPTGTPVRTVADGVVTFSGWQNGYGNVVFIKHKGAYSTVYAHLSRIAPGLKKGAKVRQGQFIGDVGSTGWATGPHLHYEVRVNNLPQNPLTVALPTAAPIDRRQREAFQAYVDKTRHQLALLGIAPVAMR